TRLRDDTRCWCDRLFANGSRHNSSSRVVDFLPRWKFSEGLARVLLPDGRNAFINRGGKVQFTSKKEVSWVEPFAEGMAKATIHMEPHRVEKVGYIDRSGRFVIPPVYEAGSSFQDGLAFVVSCNQLVISGRPVTRFGESNLEAN